MDTPEHDMASLEREFLGYAMAQAHPLVREWRGDQLEADLREVVAASVRTISDDAKAHEIAEIMHVLALPPSAYRGRLLTLGGVRLVAHIDFPDPSGDFPFVKIKGASTPLGSIADWGSLRDGLARAFPEFRPRGLHFFHPSHVPPQAAVSSLDMHLLAAPARSMAEWPDAPGLARVELRRSVSLDFYPRYQAAYEAMLDERPQLRGEVRIESQEGLMECLEQGLLWEVFADRAWAGLIAARHDLIAGVRGLQMVEIVLAKGARGQGLGPAVHQRFAHSVAAPDPAAIIMGTISPKNVPSLRTAKKAGRTEIGAYHWVDL